MSRGCVKAAQPVDTFLAVHASMPENSSAAALHGADRDREQPGQTVPKLPGVARVGDRDEHLREPWFGVDLDDE